MRYIFSEHINTQLNKLSKGDNYHSIIALFIDYGIIFLAAALSVYNLYFYPFSLFVIGSRQRALATILHEAVHNRAAKSHLMNYMLGTIMSGFLIFQSFAGYRYSHIMLHHQFLGDPEKDPDFQFHIAQGLYQQGNPRNFFIMHVISTLMLLKSLPYFIFLIKNRFFSFRKYQKEFVLFCSFWACIIVAITALHCWGYFFLFWLTPYLTTFIIIGHFIEIAEHYPLFDGNDDPLKTTRNRFSHWLEGFFLSIHNENYHLTHHLKPGIPFWNIPKAHAIMMEDPKYRQANKFSGGVFLSSNPKRLALIPALIMGKITPPNRSWI